MLIREATLDEAPIVYRLMAEAFRQYDGQLNPPSGALRETLDNTLNIMNTSGGAVIAWEAVQPLGSARYYYKDDYNREEMLHYLEELARSNQVFQARVEVRLSLPDNIAFYKKLDYQVIEELYYPERTDGWYVMNKYLKKGHD